MFIKKKMKEWVGSWISAFLKLVFLGGFWVLSVKSLYLRMILYPEALEVWFTLLTKVIENGYLPKADFPYMFPVNCVTRERSFFRETHRVKQKLDWVVVLFCFFF